MPRRPTGIRIGRAAAGLLLGAAIVLAGGTSASAHVHVDGTDATRGGYGVLTFRVPTESATASTTAVTVTLPSETPLAYAATRPMTGWTATVTTAQLAKPITTDDGQIRTYAAKVTWTAKAEKYAVAPGQFQEFALAAGPLPDRASLVLPARQTYSDGTSVNWNQVSSGGAEPEHPAPVLTLAAAAGEKEETEATVPTADVQPTAAGSAFDRIAGRAGLGLGALAVLLAGIALVRSGRRKPAER